MTTMKKMLVAAVAAATGALPVQYAVAHPVHGPDKEFAVMDMNKDGKVSAEEHTAGARSMFEKMDADKDGKVTAAEMTGAHKAVTGKAAKKSDMSAGDTIKAVDPDGDGILTADEHATASGSMFTQMDIDKDGFLSKKEMAAGHASMMKKH